MRARIAHLFTQIAVLGVLGISMALLVDQLGVSAAFCEAQGGCDVARGAAARWFGPMPLPLLALVGYSLILGLTLGVRWRWALSAMLVLATAGGLTGLALLFAQAFILRRFCTYCVGVDLLSLAVMGFVWWLKPRVKDPGGFEPVLGASSVVGYAFLVLLLPPLWAHFRPAATIPGALLPLQASDKVTLVEFVDLECPHCRALYPTLEQLKSELGPVMIVRRLHVPFARHRDARRGARLLECTRDAAQTERLERELFQSSTLGEDALVAAAERAGLSSRAVETCLNDPDSERRVDEHLRLFKALGRQGLPVTYVGGERIDGAMPKAVYRAALERVRRSKREAFGQSLAFLGIVTILAVAIYFVGARRDPPATTG